MVADTHALLWWLRGAPMLSATASGVFASCLRGESEVWVCGASLWELEWKRRKGTLELAAPVRDWLPMLDRIRSLNVVATSVEVWLRTAELDWTHRDPADRIIAATALDLGVPVLTRDRKFHEAGCPAEAVW